MMLITWPAERGDFHDSDIFGLKLSVVVFEESTCSVDSPRSWDSEALSKEEHCNVHISYSTI
jgi:hypothetical protein